MGQDCECEYEWTILVAIGLIGLLLLGRRQNPTILLMLLILLVLHSIVYKGQMIRDTFSI